MSMRIIALLLSSIVATSALSKEVWYSFPLGRDSVYAASIQTDPLKFLDASENPISTLFSVLHFASNPLLRDPDKNLMFTFHGMFHRTRNSGLRQLDATKTDFPQPSWFAEGRGGTKVQTFEPEVAKQLIFQDGGRFEEAVAYANTMSTKDDKSPLHSNGQTKSFEFWFDNENTFTKQADIENGIPPFVVDLRNFILRSFLAAAPEYLLKATSKGPVRVNRLVKVEILIIRSESPTVSKSVVHSDATAMLGLLMLGSENMIDGGHRCYQYNGAFPRDFFEGGRSSRISDDEVACIKEMSFAAGKLVLTQETQTAHLSAYPIQNDLRGSSCLLHQKLAASAQNPDEQCSRSVVVMRIDAPFEHGSFSAVDPD